MSTNNFFRSDLPILNHVAQNSMVTFPKEIVIATLRQYFSKDSYYHYVADEWGFPKTPDLTDVVQEAGLHDDVTTRLFIGEVYRQDVVFYPAIIVRHGGANYVPISFNRERGSVQWDTQAYQDGYGNITTFPVPAHFIFAGAWEGSISIDIFTRSLSARDNLAELVAILFTDIQHNNLEKSGLFIKGIQSGGVSESDERNDKLYKTTITLQFRSEWRRHVPINNVVEIINFAVEFGSVDDPDAATSANLQVNIEQTLVDLLAEL